MSLNRIINIRALIGSDRIRIPTPEKNNPTRPWTGWDTETKIRKTKNRFEKKFNLVAAGNNLFETSNYFFNQSDKLAENSKYAKNVNIRKISCIGCSV